MKNIENHYQVYPNPIKDYFQVNGDYETISILGSNGKTFFSSTQKYVNIQSLPSGMYFLKIVSSNNNIAYQKILKL